MGGIVGRLFREFAVTLSVAIAVSMVISLTATPMMCAYLLKETQRPWLDVPHQRAGFRVGGGSVFQDPVCGAPLSGDHDAGLARDHRTQRLPVHSHTQGIFPQQDNGRIQGSIQADQDTSFQAMDQTMLPMINIVAADPAVDTVNGFTGGSTYNTARLFISLKPLEERKISADLVIARLRPKLAKVPGATLFLQAAQDLRVGGRQSNAQYHPYHAGR